MEDILIDDIAGHLAASKRTSYRQEVRERFAVFIAFLQSHGLTVRVILKDGETPEAPLRIMKSDLTDEGFELVRAAYYKWLQGIDRGRPVSDVSVLERALAKIRG